ncbi:MAG: hypothetical protein M1416_02125 [Candidatus Pacearchaeota archaeon]|nr:hypothetical protein [Candidatus Pacearchaeota archaeon]
MGKQVKNILNIVAWATGVIVSLAVGFAMIGGSLTIPWLDAVGAGIVTVIAGWVVVITTIISAVMAILKQ